MQGVWLSMKKIEDFGRCWCQGLLAWYPAGLQMWQTGCFLKWKKISILNFFCHILIFKSTAVPFHPKILITLQRFWITEANNCDVSISRSYFTKKMVSSCNSWVTQSSIAKCSLKFTVSYVHNYTYQCSRHVGFLQQRDSSLWLATITYLCSTSVSCLQIFLHRLFHFILALRQ